MRLDTFFAERLGCSRKDTDWGKVLRARWSDLFAASYDILLYNLTSTYFECDQPEAANDPRKFGYSAGQQNDRRSDCVFCWPAE